MRELCETRSRLLSLVVLVWASAASPPVCAQTGLPSPQTAMEQRLTARIARQPSVASNWRLLGRLRLRRGDVPGAVDASWQAVNLDPNNVSAQFDLGQAWFASGDFSKANYHYRLAQSIAPESDYAHQASYQLAEVDRLAAQRAAPFETERRPNRFAGTPFTDARDRDDPFFFEIEMGAIYNSNVQLAPISRVVGSPGLASFQGFVAPQLEWTLWQADHWSSGVSFDGYFNANESNFDAFNLQDYQSGWFAEKTFQRGESEWTGRIEYDYTLDQFAGELFGQRHALTTLLSVERAMSESTIYWTIDYSAFEDDGVTPAVTSQDGWTNTLGVTHTFYPVDSLWELVRGGLDLQWASLAGHDTAYRGAFLYAEGEIPLPGCLTLELQTGWGYRDYPDFTGSPSRNENLWRGGVNLRRELGPHWEIALIATYDRFASNNVQYDTDRYMTGLTTTFRR